MNSKQRRRRKIGIQFIRIVGYFAKTGKKLLRGEDHPKPYAIAGIHATVFTILITILSVYVFLSLGRIQEVEIEVLREAEKINHLEPPSSAYRPSATFPMPDSVEDIEKLAKILFGLLFKNKAEAESKDIIKRGGNALTVMNVVVNSAPFPEYPLKGALTMYDRRKDIHFRDIEEVREWLNDLHRAIRAFSLLTWSDGRYLFENTVELRKVLRRNSIFSRFNEELQVTGLYSDPDFLFQSFVEHFKKANDIADSTEYQLNRFDTYRSALPAKAVVVIFVILGAIAFSFGVFLPLTEICTKKVCVVWIPTISFGLIFSVLAIIILRWML